MKLGIIGLPNVGKTTLFNALTGQIAQSENYPFCTIDPNIGVVPLPDKRLKIVREINQSKRIVPASVEFLDIAGLVKGASKGEGLGNKFLAHIREADAIIHVIRAFENENIIRVEGSTDPKRDVETINLELIFSDIEMLERRIERTLKSSKSGDKALMEELEFFKRLKGHLEEGKPSRLFKRTKDEEEILSSVFLLTEKPVIYLANISEEDLLKEGSNKYIKDLEEIAKADKAELILVSSKFEEDLASLDEKEKKIFLKEAGIKDAGLNKLIRASYKLLSLISFITIGPRETRAWTIKKGTRAKEAAGKIHTDMERGFIRAEVISFDELKEAGSMQKAKELGLIRLEGKDYIIQDGDICHFRFNV